MVHVIISSSVFILFRVCDVRCRQDLQDFSGFTGHLVHLEKNPANLVHYLTVNFCVKPAILTSKSPGSTTGLLSAPMNDKSSRRSLKFTVRLSPGSRLTFANRRSRFPGGDIEAT